MVKNEKKTFGLPPTLALLFMIMIGVAVLTWIIPSGAYDTEKVGKMTKVIAGTYHAVPGTPVGPWGMLKAISTGCAGSVKLMLTTLMIGGCVSVMTKIGAFKAGFSTLAECKWLNVYVLAFVFMAFMSVAGATAVIANSCVAFLPIGIILATGLGYDQFTGFLLVYIGCYAGFNVGWANTATLGTAHPIAELPMFSGFGARFVIYAINLLMCYLVTVFYMRKIKKDYTKSLNYREGMLESQVLGIGAIEDDVKSNEKVELTRGHIISLLGLAFVIVTQLWGSIKYGWNYDEKIASFFILGVLSGLLNGMNVEETTNAFVAGCKSNLVAALIIGFANAISVVMRSGNILNTIVYWLSIPMNHMGSIVGASFMFVANTIINLFIGSGSGQATTVMPLMVPVADLTGITRQVAVQAFQFGDGFSNCLYPNGGTLMGCLGIANVEWTTYVKWFMPLFLGQSLLACGSLTVLQLMGWTGV